MPPSPSAEPADQPAPRPPRLRRVSGGYDIDRLPIQVPPQPGEHPVSWLRRWAHRYGMTPNQLLVAVGVPPAAGSLLGIAVHIDRHQDTLAAVAGVNEMPPPPPPSVAAHALSDQLLRYFRRYHRVSPRRPSEPRFCPLCLREDAGAWQSAWTCPLLLACPRHDVLLTRSCPRCGRSPFTHTLVGADTEPWTCSLPALGDHVHRTHYQRCGHDLRTAAAMSLTSSQVGVQAMLLSQAEKAATDPHGQVNRCGTAVGHRDLLEAWLELLTEHLPRGNLSYRTSTDPAVVLDSLTVVASVMAQPDPAGAQERASAAGLLHPAGKVTPVGPDRALNARPRNPLLGFIRLTSLRDRLPASSQLVFRVANDRPRYPGIWSDPAIPPPGTTPLQWIPQQLWPDLLTPWVANDDYRGRAVAAMLLAKVGAARPWRLIAFELGLPAEVATYPAVFVRQLKRDGAWWPFLRALDQLADRLEADPPPINYQTRRWTAAMPADLMSCISRARDLLGDQAPWASPYLLTELFWQVYTGGDMRLAAPPAGLLHPRGYRGHLAELSELGDVDLRPLFTLAAEILATSTYTDPYPLTWRPP